MATLLGSLPLVGGVFGGSPQPTPVGLDKDTTKLINSGAQRNINQTSGDIENQMTSGVQNAVNSIGGNLDQEAARTAQDPHLLQAIQNQYRGRTASDLNRFKNQMDMQSRIAKGDRMSQFAQTALAQQQVQTGNYEMLANAYQQNQAARADVISSVIGLASTAQVMQAAKANRGLNSFNNNGGAMSSQGSIGGNNNPFGMDEGYGQFANPYGR